MSLDAHVRLQTGALTLDVKLSLSEGLTVLRGPTGSGKTTTLRALAGLVAHEGHVRLDGVDLTHVPPERRNVGLVFQSSAVFPHLDALGNVAFGAPSLDAARKQLEQLGALDLATRRASALSGGERQLVALARTLVRQPRLLLLDEPVSALDPRRRAATLEALRAHVAQTKCLALMVSHTAEDAAPGVPQLTLDGGHLT